MPYGGLNKVNIAVFVKWRQITYSTFVVVYAANGERKTCRGDVQRGMSQSTLFKAGEFASNMSLSDTLG